MSLVICILNVYQFFFYLGGLASFTEGVLYSWASPSIPKLLNNEFPEEISLEQASYITVLPPLSAALFCPITSYGIDKVGRKIIMLSIALPQLIAWILVIFSNTLNLLYLSRIMCGIANSIFYSALPPYIGEISTPSVRGSWGNVMTITSYIGIIAINAVGGYLDIITTAYVFISLPVIFFFMFVLMPESPYYLLMKGDQEAARTSLQILRQKKDVEKELNQLALDVQRQNSESGKWKDLIKIKSNRVGLLACFVTRFAQQFSGMAAFNVYAQYLFEQAGGELSSTVSSIIFSAVVVFMTTVSSSILDKLGRRYAMMISSGGCAVVLAAEAIYFYIKEKNIADVSAASWFPLAGLILFVVVFSMGMALVPNLILAEMFSTSIKAKGLFVTNLIFQVFVSISTKIFQVLISNFGFYTPFVFYSVCCVVSTILSVHLIPETRGKTLEEIQMAVKSKKDVA